MNEVLSILIATTALFVALWVMGWAYGEFRHKPKAPSTTSQAPESGGA